MTRPAFLCATLASLMLPALSSAQTVVPGLEVGVYATVTDPMKMSFDTNGDLFVGRDNSGSGGGFGDPVKIHRIAAGGATFVEYGNSMIPDPDAVIVDVDGIFGTAGAVLMGGIISNALGGQIASVQPDQTVVTLFGPTTTFHNPSEFVFDSLGRFLFTNHPNPATSTQGVFESTGAGDPPTLLFTTTVNISSMALDPSDQIYLATDDGRIEQRDFNGTLLDANFVTGLGYAGAPITIGQLGAVPLSLYTVDLAGDLLEVDMLGNETVIGSGFTNVIDMEFGPDDALYLTELANDRVLRLPEPSGMLFFGIAFLSLLGKRRRRTAAHCDADDRLVGG